MNGPRSGGGGGRGGRTIPAAWGAPTKRAPRLGAAEGLGWSGEGRERRMSEAAPATGWERRVAASMAANGVRAFSFVLPGAFYVFTFSKGRLFFWDCHQENKILALISLKHIG